MSTTDTEVIVEIDPESELAQALAKADGISIVIVSGGTRFEVVRAEESSGQQRDATQLREALRPNPAIFTPEEAERLKQDIYRWREEGTRPLDRP